MEFECPECGRIYATAGTCPEDFLELTQIEDDEEDQQKPFYPQDEDKFNTFDEDEDNTNPKPHDEEDDIEKKYEEA